MVGPAEGKRVVDASMELVGLAVNDDGPIVGPTVGLLVEVSVELLRPSVGPFVGATVELVGLRVDPLIGPPVGPAVEKVGAGPSLGPETGKLAGLSLLALLGDPADEDNTVGLVVRVAPGKVGPTVGPLVGVSVG